MRRATAKRGRQALLAAGVGLLCLAAAPPVAGAATDDPSVIEFTVPNDAAIDRLQRLGYDLAEYRRPNGDGTLTIAAVVTPEQRAQFEAMGYKAGDVVETPQSQAAVRAEADAAVRELARAKRNLHQPARARRGAAATDTVLTSRADYFENYAGRYVSIEARTSDGSGDRDENPVMTAAWDSGEGTELGGAGQEGVLDPYIDRDPPDANYYMYHRNIFRVGDLDDGKPMPSRVRVASANGGSDTIAVKRWTSRDGKGFPAGYLQDFNTSYVDPQQAYAKIRDLAGEFGNIAQIYDLPNETHGYQRKAQAIVGLKTPY
ncbi:MAG TPA: hypothetical protein VFG79_21620, partial [Solirubrobacter sp.]|nr:hypothetical protein [Solirubrobacter sp.]